MIRIERHKIDNTWCAIPKGNTKRDYTNPAHYTVRPEGGYTQTTRQRLQEASDKGQPCFVRTDIIIWNDPPGPCPHCGTEGTEHGKQYTIHPGPGGILTGPVHLLSPEDLAWAQAESARCWELAQKEPLFKRYYYR